MTNRHEPDPYAPNHELSPEDLVFTPEKKRHRRDYIVPEGANNPEFLIGPTRHKKKRKKMHPALKVTLIVLACLLGIFLIAFLTVLVLQQRGKAAMLPSADVVITLPEEIVQDPTIEVADEGRTVKYNGNTYRFNQNRTNILCIGVDKETLGLENEIVGTGGQADALFLLSLDTATGDMDALAISRETIAAIELFSLEGTFVGTENTQICLSYAYGDGREKSCETTVRAVSRLLYGIPISTYMAIDLNSVGILNDTIGGVDVTLSSDFRTTKGQTLSAGQQVTLWGDEALWYVRARDVDELASNNERMARQKQYLLAFSEKAIAATKENLQVPLDLYNTVSGDAITSLTPSKIVFLTSSLIMHNPSLQFASVAGEVTKGEDGYAEFHVDNKALYEQVLDIFYTKEQ